MSELSLNYCDSIDLTEDEDNAEVTSEEPNLFYFVDCSRTLDSVSPPPLSILQNALISPSTNVKHKNSAKNTRDKLQDFETITLDSDKEDSANDAADSFKRMRPITVPKKNTTYSPKRPPGKVLTIKKNNKYYKIIIPHNVMPNINKSVGPVLINIPEVGPLVISNDPQASKSKLSEMKTQQLSINLDEVDSNQNTMTVLEPPKQKSVKGLCGTAPKPKKRFLDRFNSKEEHGFNNVDRIKAKKYRNSISSAIAKLKVQLENKILEYEKFKKSLEKEDKVTLVTIDSIIGEKRTRTSEEASVSSPPRLKEPEDLQTDIVTDEYDSNLLLIKKTVNLNEEIIPKRKLNRLKYKVVKNPRKAGRPPNRNRVVKPCYVSVSKDKKIEEALERYYEHIAILSKAKKGRGRKKATSPKSIPKTSSFTERLNVALTSKIIKDEENFTKAFDARKSLTVLNKHTVMTVESVKHYYNECAKSNLIYCVKSTIPKRILKNKYFVSAIELGYVKLVSTELVCKYISGEIKFPSV